MTCDAAGQRASRRAALGDLAGFARKVEFEFEKSCGKLLRFREDPRRIAGRAWRARTGTWAA